MGLKEPTAAQVELFDACKRGDTERVRQWLASKKNKRPRTPLNFLRPSTPGTSWICAIRDPNSAYTPLHLSALHGHSEISRLLLDADPHVTTAKDRRGCIPLHLAAWSGHTNIAQLLTDFEPESVDVINNCGESSLHIASQCGYVKVVGILLDKHSDARLRNARFETALDLAAKNGHAPVVKILVNYCPELALQSAADCSMPQFGAKHLIVYPLHLAARKSHILCMQLLRFAGFDIDFATEEGSALHVAALHGEVDAVRFLLREGIKTDIRDASGRTVLEALEEHESERANDLTQVMGLKEKWRECKLIISEFVYSERRGTLSSSSDSGFDRTGDRRYIMEGGEDNVWQPIPDTAAGLTSTKMHPGADHVYKNYSGSVRLSSSSHPEAQHQNINRTWNSRLLRDAVNAEGRVVPRFPLTSPNTKARHQSSKRISDTLPLKFSVSRTSTAPSRSSILPGDNCVYRAPPTYESLPSPRRQAMPVNGYDNASNAKTWDHACSSDDFHGGTGSTRSYSATMMQPRRRYGETQTLPRGGMHLRERPSLLGTFPEEPSMATVDRNHQDLSTTNILERASVCSTSTFACSTLERRASTPARDDSIGIAPLAEPEEMVASVSNSLASTRDTPERAVSKASTPAGWDSTLSPLSEKRPSDGTSLSQEDLASLPSPNTSEMIISGVLFASSEKPRCPRTQPDDCHSPTATECSERTVASSCSIPTVSNQSLTSPSLSSSRKIGGYDTNLDEKAEWLKIDSIMQSIGLSMQDTKKAEGGHQVMRDRHSNALTLLSTLNPRHNENTIDETAVDVARFQTDALERWFKLEVGLDAVDSATMALLLQRNGFDMVEHLQISLDRLALIEMGVKDSLIHHICHHLLTSPQLRKYPQTNDLNYVSEWLQSLDLQNYLGNFFRCGLKTMIIVRSTDITQRKLNDMGIHKIGHVLRLLHSLRNVKKTATVNANTTNRNSRLSLNEQLLAGWVAFSAHFLGSVEISNVNSADEARATMTRLKKALREIAKVPQVRIEISVSGVRLSDAATGRQEAFHEISQIKIVCQDERDLNCFTYITREDDRFFCHVFCVLTADVATEIVSALGQAFECAFEQQNEQQSTRVSRDDRSSASRTIEC